MSAVIDRLPPVLRDALAASAWIVTPNKRLARRLVALHDEAQRREGRKTWTSAPVLPWDAWLRELWHDVLAEASSPCPDLIAPSASRLLWRRIVAGDALGLLDTESAARLAEEAWGLVHAWGAGGPSWRAWRDDRSSEDTAAFARWAELYSAELTRRRAIDGPLLPETLAQAAPPMAPWNGRRLLLTGFLDLTPQQERLLAALAGAGMSIDRCDSLAATPSIVQRAHPVSLREELRAAFVWAADAVRATPGRRVAVVVPDLANRRDEVVALAHDTLCPSVAMPGTNDTRLPFDLSLGSVLADVPVATSALALIRLAHGTLEMGEAAALLRSPFLGGSGARAAECLARRAGIEATWLEGGVKRVTMADVVRALTTADDGLALAWRRAQDVCTAWTRTATPRMWSDRWRDWLQRCTWPGERALDSAEWQALHAWDRVLGDVVALGAVESSWTASEAIDCLQRIAADTVFAPEGPPAPIEILGLLEAAGLPYDAVWVTGLTAEQWPAAPSPHPLLPIHWQRERNAPRASPARELAYAEALTTQLTRAAPDVVLSSALRDREAPLMPSALITVFRETTLPARAPSYLQQVAATGRLEALVDAHLPPLRELDAARGGAGLIASYADCPFQAAARTRLGTEPWPDPLEGLSAMERGELMHAALAQFWRDTQDHAHLAALSADVLAVQAAAAADAACAVLPRERWQRVPAVVAQGERARLARALRAWLLLDLARPPFRVIAIEAKTELDLGGMTLTLRLDRVDALEDGGVAIIDYKSGTAERPGRWFDAERPRSPQLGLYVLAHRAGAGDPVRAVAYVQLRPDRMEALGIAADREAWPGLAAVAAVGEPPFTDWAAVEAWWHERYTAIAQAYVEGRAEVAPRDSTACKQCGRQWLCRVGSAAVAEIPVTDE